MEQDRKKRLYELRDAHQRQAADGEAGNGPLGEGASGTEGDKINRFLKEIVERKKQRKQQLDIIQDFFENPAAYGVDTSFIPSSTTQGEIDERKDDLQHKLDLLRSVLKALEGEMELLTQVDGTSNVADAPAGDQPEGENTAGGDDAERVAQPEAAPGGQRSAVDPDRACRMEVRRDGKTVEDIPLERDKLLIGRRSANDICLRDPSVSRRHALIVPDGNGWSIVDLGSTNGTLVNGQRIQQHVLLNRDEIKLGRYLLVFHGPLISNEPQRPGSRKFRNTVVLSESLAHRK